MWFFVWDIFSPFFEFPWGGGQRDLLKPDLLEPARLQDLAGGRVDAGVPVARVDHLRTRLAVEPGGARTREISKIIKKRFS